MLDTTSEIVAVPTLLRRMNERKVMEVLMKQGPASRADLTRTTGISAPTISKAVASLKSAGLVEEQDKYLNKTGRPGRLYSLATEGVQILGVAITPSRCCVVSSGVDGDIRADRTVEFDTPGDYEQLIAAVAEQTRLVSRDQGARILGMGVSVPGLVDPDAATVLDCPSMPVLNGRDLARDFRERLNIPTVLMRQVHALCMAEKSAAAARGMEHFALIDTDADLGVALVCDGRLLMGQRGVSGILGRMIVSEHAEEGAGDRGNGNGRPPRLGEQATDAALAAGVARRMGVDSPMSVEQALEAIHSGRVEAGDLVDRAVRRLAVAVAAVVNIVEPEAVLIHGRLLDAGEGLLDRLTEYTARHVPATTERRCRILRATAGLGCGSVAGFVHHLTNSLGPRFDG